MKPIDISQLGKISTPEIKENKTGKKGDSKFEEILNAELKSGLNEKTQKVDNIMPCSQLLNVKHMNNESIFIEKGLQLCNKVNSIMENIVENIKSNKNVKTLFSNLNETLNDLLKISNSVEDKNIKDVIDRTIFLSNIELEKYIRGDYN